MFKLTTLLSLCVFSFTFASDMNAEINSTCETPKHRPGTCIALRDCHELYSLLIRVADTKVRYSTDTRKFLLESQCGYIISNETAPNHPLVCCRTYEKPETVVEHPNIHLINAVDCGKQIPRRIFGGHATKIKDFRWMALLGFRSVDESEVRFRCGGTVISDRYVLTAAHCVSGSWRLVLVRLGEHDLSKDPDCQQEGPYTDCNDPPQELDIEQIIVHPLYSRELLVNDIALIRLKGTANLDQGFVSTICLPVGIEQESRNLEHESPIVTGWGATENGSRFSNVLLQVNLTVVANDRCNAMFKTEYNKEIGDGMMCAGGSDEQKDSCNGDSGGPLMVYGVRQKSFIQMGIVSYGPRRCGTPGVPGVYTRVGHYTKWILDNMKP